MDYETNFGCAPRSRPLAHQRTGDGPTVLFAGGAAVWWTCRGGRSGMSVVRTARVFSTNPACTWMATHGCGSSPSPRQRTRSHHERNARARSENR